MDAGVDRDPEERNGERMANGTTDYSIGLIQGALTEITNANQRSHDLFRQDLKALHTEFTTELACLRSDFAQQMTELHKHCQEESKRIGDLERRDAEDDGARQGMGRLGKIAIGVITLVNAGLAAIAGIFGSS